MKSSIRTKITLMVIIFVTFVVGVSWLFCNYLIDGIFVSKVKKDLVITFNSCNELFVRQKSSDENNDGDLYGKIQNPNDAVVVVFGTEGQIYTSINDNNKMVQSLRNIISSIKENSSGITLTRGDYVITKNHDVTINADYYDLIGILDNNYFIVVRSPIAHIEATMQLLTSVFTKIAIGLTVLGSIFLIAFSNIFSAPIKKLSHAAKRMTKLDFDVKVPVTTNDEIGELGACMNEMSSKLEETISKLKTANLKLQGDIEQKKQIDEMRREFLSHVSHELKTPIALIQGYAEGLKDNLFDDPESMEFYADVIIDESQKMNTLVRKLLNLNEIEFGEQKLNIERFELVGFISDIIASSRILIEEADATIVYDEEVPVYVWADEYMIEEVFTNYLTNAIHYVKSDGIIKIYFERSKDNVRVCVYNEGNQIADEDIDKLFVKFYKVDKARTREYGGNGIGLSIVAASMEAHGKDYGVFNCENGVTFYFDLDANMPC